MAVEQLICHLRFISGTLLRFVGLCACGFWLAALQLCGSCGLRFAQSHLTSLLRLCRPSSAAALPPDVRQGYALPCISHRAAKPLRTTDGKAATYHQAAKPQSLIQTTPVQSPALIARRLRFRSEVLLKPFEIRLHRRELHLRLVWTMRLARQHDHSRRHAFHFQCVIKLVAL